MQWQVDNMKPILLSLFLLAAVPPTPSQQEGVTWFTNHNKGVTTIWAVTNRVQKVDLSTTDKNFSVALQPAQVTNLVNKLAESGMFCHVRGHVWQTNRCGVCGKVR